MNLEKLQFFIRLGIRQGIGSANDFIEKFNKIWGCNFPLDSFRAGCERFEVNSTSLEKMRQQLHQSPDIPSSADRRFPDHGRGRNLGASH